MPSIARRWDEYPTAYMEALDAFYDNPKHEHEIPCPDARTANALAQDFYRWFKTLHNVCAPENEKNKPKFAWKYYLISRAVMIQRDYHEDGGATLRFRVRPLAQLPEKEEFDFV